MTLGTVVAALALSAVHVVVGPLQSRRSIAQNGVRSAGGGIAIAFVFVYLLPRLATGQEAVGEARPFGGLIQNHVYLAALAGFVLFFGLEQVARRSAAREDSGQDPSVFWAHVAAFAAYNLLIGYLLVHHEGGAVDLALYAVALGLHLLGVDYGLRRHFQEQYHDIGRWLLAATLLAGWGIGQLTAASPLVEHVLFAFLSGGLVLNVVKEELPADRESRFLPFLVGVVVYTPLLLAL